MLLECLAITLVAYLRRGADFYEGPSVRLLDALRLNAPIISFVERI
jgi:hypothetical protein